MKTLRINVYAYIHDDSWVHSLGSLLMGLSAIVHGNLDFSISDERCMVSQGLRLISTLFDWVKPDLTPIFPPSQDESIASARQ